MLLALMLLQVHSQPGFCPLASTLKKLGVKESCSTGAHLKLRGPDAAPTCFGDAETSDAIKE